MNDGCPRCGEYAAAGRSYCGECGRRLDGVEYPHPAPDSSPPSSTQPERARLGVLEAVLLAVCFVVIAVVVFEIIVVVIHYPDVAALSSGILLRFYVIVPFPQIVFSMSGFALLLYWSLALSAIVTSAALMIQRFFDKTGRLKRLDRPDAVEDTAAFWVGISLCASFIISVIITILTISSGSEITVPDFGGVVEQILSLVHAVVWEELVTRLLYIGVPMAVISLIVTKKWGSLRSILGGFGMSTTAVILIIISSTIFGLAHYPGWEDQAWKVVSAALMGVFLGYVFVRFGLYASIMLHFVNNFLTSFNWMGLEPVLVVLELFFLAAGIVALVYIVKRMLDLGGSGKPLPLFQNSYSK